jgi:hemerythrin-like domain-containing protein
MFSTQRYSVPLYLTLPAAGTCPLPAGALFWSEERADKMTHPFFRTLEQEHEELKEILDQLENTPRAAMKEKKELFTKLKTELMPHMKGEEKHFYPLLLDSKSARKQSMEALEEHHVAEMVLKELDKLDKGEEQWDAKLKVFKEILEHHIEEEEEELFETAQDNLDQTQLDKIMAAYSEEKKKIQQKYR